MANLIKSRKAEIVDFVLANKYKDAKEALRVRLAGIAADTEEAHFGADLPELRRLSQKYGSGTVFADSALRLQSGEEFGYLYLNHCGWSTGADHITPRVDTVIGARLFQVTSGILQAVLSYQRDLKEALEMVKNDHEKLTGALANLRTYKQLEAAWPELYKSLPTELLAPVKAQLPAKVSLSSFSADFNLPIEAESDASA